MRSVNCIGIGVVFGSGASFHMTGDKKIFSDLEEKDIQMHIELGKDGWYSATIIDTITFQRASCKLFHLKDVMHVPSLKKKLISIAMLEDRGYDVVFSEGKFSCDTKQQGKPRRLGFELRISKVLM